MNQTPPAEHSIDCVGLQCPAPILKITKQARKLKGVHAVLTVTSDDDEFPPDLKAWCRSLGATLVALEQAEGVYEAKVELNRPKEHTNVEEPTVATDSRSAIAASQAAQHAPPAPTRQMEPAPAKPAEPPAPVAQATQQPQPALPAPTANQPQFVDLRGNEPSKAIMLLGAALVEAGPSGVVISGVGSALREAVEGWCRLTDASFEPWPGHPGEVRGLVRPAMETAPADPNTVPRTNQMTILVVRNDFESLMSAFMCATASRASGMDVVMYFAFWGVNVLRAQTPRPGPDGAIVRSSFLQSMMKMMMPAGPEAQKMSKMHMGGMGLGMMKYFMRQNNVMSMSELIDSAIEQGVVFKVCTMSMGIMGIAKTDLMDLPNIEFGGVTSFTAEARISASSLVF